MMLLIYILHALVIVSAVAYLRRRMHDMKLLFVASLAFKILCGVLIGVIYKYYYTAGDTFAFIHDGNIIAQIFASDPAKYFHVLSSREVPAEEVALSLPDPRSFFLSKMVSVFSLVTNGDYWLISVYFSVISFAGCWFFVRTVQHVLPHSLLQAVVAFLCIPSFVFWSSGVIKESLATGAIAFISAVFLRFWFNERLSWWQLVIAILAALLGWKLKYYYAAVLLMVIATTLGYRRLLMPYLRSRQFVVHALLWLLVFSVPLMAVSLLHPNFRPHRFFQVVFDNYMAFQHLSEPGDAVTFAWPAPDITMLLNAPWALFSGLFRPFLWETNTIFQVYIALENMVGFLLVFIAVRSVRSDIPLAQKVLLLAAIVYISVLCTMLTLSTPNFGTLSRYKTAFQPFYVMLLLSSPDATGFLQRTFARLVKTKV